MCLALRDRTVQIYDRDVGGVIEEHNIAGDPIVGVEYYDKFVYSVVTLNAYMY